MKYNPFSPQFIRKALQQNNLWLSKNRGQNYLIDKNTADKMMELIPPDSPVFEVGTGLGALTHLIMKRQEIYAIEIDKGIFLLLLQYVPALMDSLHHQDFLKMDLSVLEAKHYFFVSNLPYSISGEAIKIFINSPVFSRGVLMLQKEFVSRMNAPVGSKFYAVMSILSQTFLDIEIQFDVKRSAYFPAPSVDSQVITISKKQVDIRQDAFRDFLVKSFSAKRKTLANNMKKLGISTEQILSLGIDPGKRPQELDPLQWQSLYKTYCGST